MPVAAIASPLLEGQSLNTYYGHHHVLRDVTLSISSGETVGLMGRNGMGKTTLMRTLVGLVHPLSGRVMIDGAEVTSLPTYAIAQRGIAYVPEGRGIFANLTVSENLAIAEKGYSQAFSHWTREGIFELFPRLAERRGHWGDRLSGGEQQMLAIGRALLTNPRLIMLDEATEGLAPLIRDEIWHTIGRIRAAGMATLVVDKAVAAVAQVADRIVILVKGEVVLQGTPAELKAQGDLMHRHLGV